MELLELKRNYKEDCEELEAEIGHVSAWNNRNGRMN